MPERPALCASGSCRPGEHGGPRRTAPGSALCDVCRDRFREDLEWVADAWADLQDRLAVGGKHAGEPVKGTKVPGLVINEQVSDALRAVTGWTWDQVQLIVDQRTDRIIRLPAQDTPTLLHWLAKWHAPWLTDHESNELAAELAGDAHRLRSQVRRAAYPSGARVVEFCSCTEHATTEAGERVLCDGVIRAVIHHTDDRLPPVIACDGSLEQHVWAPSQWHALARRLRIAAPDQDAAAHFLRQISA